MYKVILVRDAKIFYESCNVSDLKKINRAVGYLKSTPRIHPNIKPLKGTLSGMYRYRAGDLRIIYVIQDKNLIVTVLDIDHRGSIYS